MGKVNQRDEIQSHTSRQVKIIEIGTPTTPCAFQRKPSLRLLVLLSMNLALSTHPNINK
jgi:hypothetical protein